VPAHGVGDRLHLGGLQIGRHLERQRHAPAVALGERIAQPGEPREQRVERAVVL
jgi:hypothetical protein